MFTPQEIEALKRGVYAALAAIGGVLLAYLTPGSAWDTATVVKACAFAAIAALLKLYASGRMDAARNKEVVAQAAAGAPLTALKASDVGAAVVGMGQAPPP